MKITELRPVKVQIPQAEPKTKPRRRSWLQTHPRARPLSKYPEFVALSQPMLGFEETPVWVQVTAECGTWGLGLCSFGEAVAAIVRDLFAPLLTGRDCLASEYLNDLMWRSTQRLGAAGHAAIAQSGVDLALWDLKGKLLGMPVYRLLGGPCRERIPLYSTGDDLDWAMELGFTRFKIANPVHYDDGTPGLDKLEEVCHGAREVVGADAELMLNPVMSFNVEYAVRVAERLRPYDLRWLEEPLIPADLRGHIELKKAIPWMPIATGEDHHGRHAFLQLIENRCVDVVQPDLKWCGGLSEAVKIYTLAEAAGIPTILHAGANTPFGQHFSLAYPESPLAEFFLGSDPGVPLDQTETIPGTPVPKEGFITPSDAPGFGMEIKEEWISPWR